MVPITVVIPLYNKAAYVLKAVESVREQTYSDWKLLIINDASTDDSMTILEPTLADRRIRCLTLRHNIGLTHVLNYALTQIDTPYFVQLDADDWLDPVALEKQIGAVAADPEIAFAYGNHRQYVEDEGGRLLKVEDIIVEQYQDCYDLLRKLNPALVPRFYRTSCVRVIGGWLTHTPGDLYVEDVQMQLRLATRFRWVWIDAVLYHRRRYPQNLDEFETNRPLRWQYRHDLYNQMLREWGDRYRAEWRRVGEAIYLQNLVLNEHPEKKVPQWNIPS